MRIFLLTVFLSAWSLVGSLNAQQSLKQILELSQSSDRFVVEGYYVDNSSFMVIRSSNLSIVENKRYQVFENKTHNLSYTKTPDGKMEVPVIVPSGMVGKKRPRILLLNTAKSKNSQLVVDETDMFDLPIVEGSLKYRNYLDDSVEMVLIDDLLDFLFYKGQMPSIEQIKD